MELYINRCTYAPSQNRVIQMAKDAELDRLKAVQDQAFRRKQDAYPAQQRAWEKRSSARDAMNRAFEAKQRAYDAQQSAWQDYQRVKSSNGPRIDSLNAQQESAFQSMKRAYDNASSASANETALLLVATRPRVVATRKKPSGAWPNGDGWLKKFDQPAIGWSRTSTRSRVPRSSFLAPRLHSRPQSPNTNARRPNSSAARTSSTKPSKRFGLG